MFNEYFSQKLKEDEEIVKVIRKHWASFIFPIFKTFLILIFPFIFSSFLFNSLIGVMIFFIWIGVGLAYGFYQWLCWYFDHFIITNQRIVNVNQKRLFSRSVSEASLSSIQDVTYEISGMFASIFNYGTVKVMTASSSDSIKMDSIERPKETQGLIMDLHKDAKKSLSAQELIDFLETSRSDFIKEAEDSEKSTAEEKQK